MIEFILERYNYLIVITLMMIGLYIVFSRGNLVKTIIGLNIFQTSVFIFYITVGKVAGGTAPILLGGYGGGHGDGHGDDHGKGNGADYDKAHDTANHGVVGQGAASQGPASQGQGDHSAASSVYPGNDLEAAIRSAGDEAQAADSALRSVPAEFADATNQLQGEAGLAAGDTLNQASTSLHDLPTDVADHAGDHANTLHQTGGAHDGDPHGADYAGEAAAYAGEILYSNPLPHVLILTAIVVGVATTAVGLALAVRIQEAYGTIEEDELEAEDYKAEFGRPITEEAA
ncbi:sodium:proton antiporter [Parvularcula sp. IMCC14364]|uniref:sodium:proton antiporter n=1 Tax=Parvularcula sp. IMCC14364 TaxID=3067902 RepID=UPI0027414AEF|nr:cation:proton antiporter subunit C [Parvularcula sp. IMCC14364]